MDNFLSNMLSVLNAIDMCLTQKLTLPALILIYSCIDILGSLERDPTEGTNKSFIRWAENYLLKATHLDCTALELFGARCAILHTLTPDSDLSTSGQARTVIYAWGTAKLEDINAASKILNKHDVVSVHITELAEALKLGLSQFVRDLAEDEVRKSRVEVNASKTFTATSIPLITQFITMFGGEEKPSTSSE